MKQLVYTPTLIGFYKNIGVINGIDIKESTLQTQEGDIVLLTGSILDKSEIAYRSITHTEGIYYVVIPSRLKKEDIDPYWHLIGSVVYVDEIIAFLQV